MAALLFFVLVGKAQNVLNEEHSNTLSHTHIKLLVFFSIEANFGFACIGGKEGVELCIISTKPV